MAYRAVIFDLGGVVFPSPFEAFDAYDHGNDLEEGHDARADPPQQRDRRVGRARTRRADAWTSSSSRSRPRRSTAGFRLDARRLMGLIGSSLGPAARDGARDRRSIRATGLRTAALTNNWADETQPLDAERAARDRAVRRDRRIGRRRTAQTRPAHLRIGARPPERARVRDRVPRRPRHEPEAGARRWAWRRSRSSTPTTRSPSSKRSSGSSCDEREPLTWTCCWVRHAEPERIAPGTRRSRRSRADRARPRAGRAARGVARARADRRRAVEPAAPRGRDRGADRARARARGADRRRADRVRRAVRHATSRWRSCARRTTRTSPRCTRAAGRSSAPSRPTSFRARVAATLDEIVAAHPGRRVVAVCHGGVINVAFAIVLGLDRHLWFEPHYTSLSRHGRVAHRRALARVAQRTRAPRRAKGAGMTVDIEHVGRVTVVTIDRPERAQRGRPRHRGRARRRVPRLRRRRRRTTSRCSPARAARSARAPT